MKLRKILACVLAAAQLAFGAFLTAKATKDTREAELHRAALLQNGTEYDVALREIWMNEWGDGRIGIDLTVFVPEAYTDHRFVAVSPDAAGRLRFTDAADTAPLTGPYLKSELLWEALINSETFLSPAAAVLLYVPTEDEETSYWWLRADYDGQIRVNGTPHTLCARARLYEEDIVFTGVVIDGTFYAFE